MWKLNVWKSRHLPMSKAVIKRVAKAKIVPGERNLSGTRAAILEQQIEAGDLLAFRWVLGVLPDGTEYRINGQHTSRLFLNGLKAPKQAHVSLEVYDCDDLHDVVDLWSRFDPQISSRSKQQVVQTWTEGHADLKGIKRKTANLAVGAIAIHTYGAGVVKAKGLHERCALLNEHAEFVRWLDTILTGKDRCHLLRTGVVWAIFRCWLKNKSACKEFWQQVAEGEGEKLSPPRKLERFLMLTVAKMGGGAKAVGIPQVEAREYMAKCIFAWNAWRQGQACLRTLRYHRNRPDPEVL